MFLRPSFLLLPLAAALMTTPAHAVVVATTTGNVTAPGDDPGWNNVGICNSAGAVYLGNRWVLTAFHVNASAGFPVVFNNTAYPTVPGTGVQLSNNGAVGMTAQTDLIMFQIASDPGLPSPVISATAPTVGDDIVMIGNGMNRQAGRTFWQVTMNAGVNNDTWTETLGAHNVEGFKDDGTGQAKRWGTNDAEAVGLNVYDGVGTVRGFVSIFDDDASGRPNEAQGILGDSGGGVFHKNGAQWELSGMIVAVGTQGNPGAFDNPPVNTAAFGQHLTLMADLSFYRTQILAIMVPEPGVTALAGAGALMLLRRRQRGSAR